MSREGLRPSHAVSTTAGRKHGSWTLETTSKRRRRLAGDSKWPSSSNHGRSGKSSSPLRRTPHGRPAAIGENGKICKSSAEATGATQRPFQNLQSRTSEFHFDRNLSLVTEQSTKTPSQPLHPRRYQPTSGLKKIDWKQCTQDSPKTGEFVRKPRKVWAWSHDL